MTTIKGRGYMSPRNACYYMMQRGAIITAAMVHEKHPQISVEAAGMALVSCVAMGQATESTKGSYEIVKQLRVRTRTE